MQEHAYLSMPTNALKSQVAAAIHACESKKAEDLAILQMDKNSSAFTDYFVICSGSNPRQVQAISDEVELQLKQDGFYPNSIEGFKQAEWVLLDYVDFVVHVFSQKSRQFYDLERLWKSAKKITLADLEGKASRASTKPVAASVSAAAKRSKPAKRKSVSAIGKAVKSATSRSGARTAAKASAKPARKSSAKKKGTRKKK